MALNLYTKILEKHPNSPRALYGKARALDLLAEQKQSNQLLLESISFYQQVLEKKNLLDDLFMVVAERCINRLRFIGRIVNI